MNILLVEPDYKNKYPPMGLMKISTYHRERGDKVKFFKGKMSAKNFIPCGFDRVYTTTLFTFYYDRTIDTILHYKKMINSSSIFVGGIMASLLTEKLKEDTGIANVLVGLLTNSACLGLKDSLNVDEMPLDYAILDEIEYSYPAGDNYISYTTRGCPNRCKFCAVPILEPEYVLTNNIHEQISRINDQYGEKRNLLLLDNNVFNLSCEEMQRMVQELESLGFTKRPTFKRTSPFEQYLLKLGNPQLAKRILTEAVVYLTNFKEKIRQKDKAEHYQTLLDEMESTEERGQFLEAHKEEIRQTIKENSINLKLQRYVDFNQGLEAARITPEKMQILAQLPLRPVRIAFDHYNNKAVENYKRAIGIAHDCGVNDFSNYMLYNFDDSPEDLWNRLKINVDLAETLHCSIFSFPMKYMPIESTDRKHVGEAWSRKYLEAISAILLVKKGIVACGRDFFYRAFGKNLSEYYEILAMPRDFIIYRNYYEKSGHTQRWREEYRKLSGDQKESLLKMLSDRNMTPEQIQKTSIMKFYEKEYSYLRIMESEKEKS